MKKKTRAQKTAENPKRGGGKSRYALKVSHRKEEAAKLGLKDTPYPVLAVIEEIEDLSEQ